MTKRDVQKNQRLSQKTLAKENIKALTGENVRGKHASKKAPPSSPDPVTQAASATQVAQTRSRHPDHSDDLREIKALIKKGAGRLNRFFYVGVVIGIVMGPLVLLGALMPGGPEFLQSPEGEPPFAMIFGGGMTLLFGVALIEQYGKYRKDNRLLSIITHSPQEIVWIYKEISKGEITSSYGTSGTQIAQFIHVHFHLTDGTHHLIWLSEANADHLIDLLHRTFPHISCGYAPHIQEAYRRDPIALRRAPHYSDAVREVKGRTKI